MNIDIDSFALYIGVKAEYLAMLYRTTCELEGLPLPKRNRHGKVKMSEVLIFKQHVEDKNKGGLSQIIKIIQDSSTRKADSVSTNRNG